MKEIKLSKDLVALVDDEDFERVNAFKWSASHEGRATKWYAIRYITDHSKPKKKFVNQETRQIYLVNHRTKIRMHRFILGLGPGKESNQVVDHINHNSLDNRKCNLEIIDQEENMRRSPGWCRKDDSGDICL